MSDAVRVQALAIYRDFLTCWRDADLSIPLLQKAKGGIREIAVVAVLLLGTLDWRLRLIPGE